VLVLTGIRDEREHCRAIAAGASGVVPKTAPTSEIAAAIRKLAAGVPLIAPAEARALMERGMAHQRRTDEERELLSRLSPREREVLAALADGLDNEAIAGRMSVGAETVRSHIVRILRKLEVESRLQAAVLAIRHGYGGGEPLT
jgi:DNA-binding NarL/FixJ family response regulator